MSANNVVWYMQHDGMWHVWYSGCMDNTPKQPDFENGHYKEFNYRVDAIVYAHSVVKKIDEEAYKEGFTGVEYGVCEVPTFSKKRNYLDRGKLERIDKIINEWKQKIKDLQFSIEQFENWKEELIGNSKGKIDCNECEFYGECDHQGAYQKDGKWCYEDLVGEKEKARAVWDIPSIRSKIEFELKEKLPKPLINSDLETVFPKKKPTEIEPDYKIYAPALTQDKIDKILKRYRDIDEEISELKRQIYEDLLACRGMDYKEMICHILDLESKYDEQHKKD